jgi:hypothetical protein
MPDIPTVTSPAEISIPQMSPQMAGEPGAALARSGEQISSSADYGIQVSEKIRDAQNHLALLAAGNQVDASWDKYQETLRQSGDPDNLPNPEEWKDNLKATFAADPKYADPRVAHALDAHIDSVGEDARHLTVMRQLTLQGQQEEANLGQLQTNVAFEMAEASDTTARSLARGKYEIAVADAERHGWITPQQAEINLRTLDSTAEEVEIVDAINKADPASIGAMIDKTINHPELFKDINPNHFAELKKTLRANYDTALNAQTKANVAAQGDFLLHQYRSDITLSDPESKRFDFTLAAQKVNDDPNVPTDVKKYVRDELDAEGATDQKARQQASDKAEKQITDAMAVQDFGKARQLLKQNLPALVKGRGEELDRAIVARATKTDADISNADDAKEYLRIKQMDPSDPAAIQKEIIGTPNLKTSTRDKLVDWLDAISDKTIKNGIEAGDKFLQSQIAPSKGAMVPTIPAQEAKSAEAQQALSDWVKTENRNRATAKARPLSEQEIFTHAEQIAPAYQMTVSETMNAMQNEAAPGASSTPTPQTPPKGATITRVRVIRPDGKTGTIPKSQLPDALKQGFREAK